MSASSILCRPGASQGADLLLVSELRSRSSKPIYSYQTSSAKQSSSAVPRRDQYPSKDVKTQGYQAVQKAVSSTTVQSPSNYYNYARVKSEQEEIRVLEVHAGKEPECLKCTMRTTILGAKNMLPYETISYSWGQYKGPSEVDIEIDGTLVSVRGNAAEALYRMRDPSKNRLLWVDAVCINQRDKAEKSAQIRIMGHIYKSTWRNLIWLGPDGGHAEAAMHCLQSLLQDIRAKLGNYRNLRDCTSDADGVTMKPDGVSIDRSIDLTALHAVFLSSWFERRWTVEEAVLPSESWVHFGPATFSLPDILRASVWILYNSHKLPAKQIDSSNLSEAASLWYLADRQDSDGVLSMDLFTVYGMTQYTHAYNREDYVHALLGMVKAKHPDSEPHLARLKAGHGRPLAETFSDATRIMIEDNRRMDILRDVDMKEDGTSWMNPSWAYDFHDCDGVDYDYAYSLGPQYSAAGSSWIKRHTNSSCGDPRVLVLRGFVVDVVSERTDCYKRNVKPTHPNGAIPFLRNARAYVQKLANRDTNRRDILLDLAYTLVAGRNCLQQRASLEEVMELAHFLAYVDARHEVPSLEGGVYEIGDEKVGSRQAAMRYYRTLDEICHQRRFYTTNRGRLGLGPAGLRNGDIVTIMYGSPVPLVLRPVRGDAYLLVGSTYLHGTMEGEELKRHEKAREPDLDFHLI